MAWTLIAKSTLTSSQSSVVFGSVPSSYADLFLCISARSTNVSNNSSVSVSTNNTTNGGNQFWRVTQGAQQAGVLTNTNTYFGLYIPAAAEQANTYGYMTFYIPSYPDTSLYRIFTSIGATGGTSASRYIAGSGGSQASGTAINSVTITEANSDNFVSGSSFYLFGVA